MIVSFKNNFIFIKTRKTAGTTIEVALTPSCGHDDILTLISPEDELSRLQKGRVAARNYAGDPILEARIAKAIIKHDERRWRKLKKRAYARGSFKNHSSAAKIKEKMSKDFWDSAFKFTVERHPYEKVVSTVFWRNRKRRRGGDSSSGVSDQDIESIPDDFKLYSIDGEVVIDKIIRQESLERDLQQVSERLGLRLPRSLPSAKAGYRVDRRPAESILTADQKKAIYDRYRRTFDLMGYEP